MRTRTASKTASSAKTARSGTRAATPNGSKPARGRPPKKVFINVLVRESTRAGLSRLKIASALSSQGEVIDRLVADVMERRPKRRRERGGAD